MKLYERLLGERRQTRPLTDATLIDILGGGWDTDAGVDVTPDTALRLTAVWRCLSLLTGVASAMPLHPYRKRKNGGRQAIDVPVIRDPHPDKTPMETWEYAFLSILMHGNAFFGKGYDGLGRLRRLTPLHPSFTVKVSDEYVDDGNPAGKRFYVTGKTEEFYTPAEILHIPGMSTDGVVGLSPIQYARQSLGLGLASEKYAGSVYKRGTLLKGFLTAPGEVSEDDAERTQAQWRERAEGEAGWHKIPILFGGLEFKPLQLPLGDALVIEAAKLTVEQIARLYGVPLHLLAESGASSNWGTGVETHGQQLLVFTVDPLLVKFEQRVSREVAYATDPNVYVRFQRSALLRPNTEKRYAAYQRAVSYGWMSTNEIRALEELDPVEGGDAYWMPTNLQEIGTGDESAPSDPTPVDLEKGEPPYDLPEDEDE